MDSYFYSLLSSPFFILDAYTDSVLLLLLIIILILILIQIIIPNSSYSSSYNY